MISQISALGDSSGRTYTCTGAALDASIRIDVVLRISLRDCSYRALRLAGTARNTRIRNYVCHDTFLLKNVTLTYSLSIIIISPSGKRRKYKM
jgi:hypothetical protein